MGLHDHSYVKAQAAAQAAQDTRERGEQVETFRIIERRGDYAEEEWSGLSLGEAALKMDDLTGVGADLILSDFDEDCAACIGTGGRLIFDHPCLTCHGTGKRRGPWEFTDPDTGREVVMRREVE